MNQMWKKLSSDELYRYTPLYHLLNLTDGYKQRRTSDFSSELIGFEQNRRGFHHDHQFQWLTW